MDISACIIAIQATARGGKVAIEIGVAVDP